MVLRVVFFIKLTLVKLCLLKSDYDQELPQLQTVDQAKVRSGNDTKHCRLKYNLSLTCHQNMSSGSGKI